MAPETCKNENPDYSHEGNIKTCTFELDLSKLKETGVPRAILHTANGDRIISLNDLINEPSFKKITDPSKIKTGDIIVVKYADGTGYSEVVTAANADQNGKLTELKALGVHRDGVTTKDRRVLFSGATTEGDHYTRSAWDPCKPGAIEFYVLRGENCNQTATEPPKRNNPPKPKVPPPPPPPPAPPKETQQPKLTVVSTSNREYLLVRDAYLKEIYNPIKAKAENLQTKKDNFAAQYQVAFPIIEGKYKEVVAALDQANVKAKELREKADKTGVSAEADKLYKQAKEVLCAATKSYREFAKEDLENQLKKETPKAQVAQPKPTPPTPPQPPNPKPDPPKVDPAPQVSKTRIEYYEVRKAYIENSFGPFKKRLEDLEKIQSSLTETQATGLPKVRADYSKASKDFELANQTALNLRVQAEKLPNGVAQDKLFQRAGKALTEVAEKHEQLLRGTLISQIQAAVPETGMKAARDSFEKALEKYVKQTKPVFETNYEELKRIDLDEAGKRDPIHRKAAEELLVQYNEANRAIVHASNEVEKKRKAATELGNTPQAAEAWKEAKALLEGVDEKYGRLGASPFSKQLAEYEAPLFKARFEGDRHALQMVKDAGWKIEVEKRYNTERNGMGSLYSHDDLVNINPAALKGPLAFRDPIFAVRFSRQEKVVVKLDENGLVESINGKPVTSANKETSRYYTNYEGAGRNNDCWNGYIIPNPKNGEIEVKAFKQLSRSNKVFNHSNRIVSLPIDLSPLGEEFKNKTVETTFRQVTVAPLRKEQAYDLYSTGLTESQLKPFEKKITAYANGIKAAEGFFDYKPGKLAKIIHVIDTDDTQAYQSAESVCVITDEKLKTSERSVWLTGFHEAAHSFDARFSISEELRQLYGQITKINSDTFHVINEKQFITGAGGGHSEANERELFASIMVSLVNDEWEKKVRQMDPAHRFNYNLVLKRIDEIMDSKEISRTIEVRRSLTEKIAFLDSLNQPKRPT